MGTGDNNGQTTFSSVFPVTKDSFHWWKGLPEH